MKLIENKQFDEERALYALQDAEIRNCKFAGPRDGESALKECKNIVVDSCYFDLRYPFWHATHFVIKNTELTINCRAALWYGKNIEIKNGKLLGIKALRECKKIQLRDSYVVSPEFLWRVKDITLDHVHLESEYPFFECAKGTIDGLTMKGKYSFQYTKDLVIKNSNLDTKDAFWHAKNITVVDSVVKGEYLGWYSDHLKLIRCKIIGTQPLCYCKNLVLEDCTMEDTDLSFERSQVQARIIGNIKSVKNPLLGKITADSIDELIMETDYVNPLQTKIDCKQIGHKCFAQKLNNYN